MSAPLLPSIEEALRERRSAVQRRLHAAIVERDEAKKTHERLVMEVNSLVEDDTTIIGVLNGESPYRNSDT